MPTLVVIKTSGVNRGTTIVDCLVTHVGKQGTTANWSGLGMGTTRNVQSPISYIILANSPFHGIGFRLWF